MDFQRRCKSPLHLQDCPASWTDLSSLSQYETQLRDTLGLRKKLKAEQWPKVYNYARSQGYQSFDLYLSGNMTPWVKAWKEIRRSGAHKLPLDSGKISGAFVLERLL